MKQLTICTHKYSRQLENFVARPGEAAWLVTQPAAWRDGVFSATCQYYHGKPPDFAKGLMGLLTDIAMQENPIYQHSPKLRAMASDLCNTPLYAMGLNSLARFIKRSNLLHLEGYVTFRMTDYCEKLDLLSYSLIKKIKFAKQD